MSNFCLLPDKMDNRVIHDIVALNIHIKVIIIGAIIMKGVATEITV